MYSLLPLKKNDKIYKTTVLFPLDLESNRWKYCCSQLIDLSCFLINLLNTKESKALFTFVVDSAWKESR